MIRSDQLTNRAVVPSALTDRQRAVLATAAQYYAATGEACSVSYVARRLGVSRAAIRDHVQRLADKGFLRAPSAAAFARMSFR